MLPKGYQLVGNQVAGHTFQVGSDEVGLVKREADASILKPEGSPFCASREIKFYENVKKDENDEDIQMWVTRNVVVDFQISPFQYDVMLEDWLDFIDPCFQHYRLSLPSCIHRKNNTRAGAADAATLHIETHTDYVNSFQNSGAQSLCRLGIRLSIS